MHIPLLALSGSQAVLLGVVAIFGLKNKEKTEGGRMQRKDRADGKRGEWGQDKARRG
jgi:hypothetical protein